MNPPKYFYAFYHSSDRKAYALLEKIRRGKKVEIFFTQDDLNEFFKRAIMSSKATDWRKFFSFVVKGLDCGRLDLAGVNTRPAGFRKGCPEWVFYEQDKELCRLVDGLAGKKFTVKAGRRDVLEFVLRFIQTELIHDWRGPKLAILFFASGFQTGGIRRTVKLKGGTCDDDRRRSPSQLCPPAVPVDLKKLNGVLRSWDFTGLVKG